MPIHATALRRTWKNILESSSATELAYIIYPVQCATEILFPAYRNQEAYAEYSNMADTYSVNNTYTRIPYTNPDK